MENLSEIKENIRAIKPLESKRSKLNERLHAAEAEVESLLLQYEKESLDVQQMQKETLSSFVLKMLGKFKDKLEKEKREEIEAKLMYDEAMSDLEEIRQERQELGLRISDLRHQARLYDTELDKRKKYVHTILSETDAQEYKQLEDELDMLTSQITEINEAQRAAVRARGTARSAIDSLKSADGWATYDIWARAGFLSHAAKYSHIDDAEACFNRLVSQMKSLRKELGDVKGFSAADLTQISPSQRIVDFWFDNIFTDLSVRSQIRENLDRLNHLLGALNNVEKNLNEKSRTVKLQIENIKSRQEDLLVSSQTDEK